MTNAYARVRCAKCEKEYICTPDHDYYNATTATDGLCWSCMLTIAGMENPPPEPGYISDDS